jgi:LPXTG-site transpeptidase (sortase) family protein
VDVRYRDIQSDPDFKRVYRRAPQTSSIRPSVKYFNDVILTQTRTSKAPEPEVIADKAKLAVSSSSVSRKSGKASVKSLPFKKIKRNLPYLAGLVLIVVGILSTSVSIKQNQTSAEQIKKIASAANQDSSSAPPSEEKPSAPISSYIVAPNLPAIVKIPKLNVEARIKPVGVNASNKLIAPNNIYDTGWYNASAKPGDSGASGAMVLEGHVHGPTLPGIFNNLKKLTSGDLVTVKRGDGTILTYKVVKQKNVETDKFDMADALSSVQPGIHGLNLITCSGNYDKSGHYDQRLIVYTVLVK